MMLILWMIKIMQLYYQGSVVIIIITLLVFHMILLDDCEYIENCDRILENGSKSHMKSIVFQHVFNCISTKAHVFPEYLLHNFDNLSIKFHVMI